MKQLISCWCQQKNQNKHKTRKRLNQENKKIKQLKFILSPISSLLLEEILLLNDVSLEGKGHLCPQSLPKGIYVLLLNISCPEYDCRIQDKKNSLKWVFVEGSFKDGRITKCVHQQTSSIESWQRWGSLSVSVSTFLWSLIRSLLAAQSIFLSCFPLVFRSVLQDCSRLRIERENLFV